MHCGLTMFVLTAFLAATTTASAHWAMPTDAPVDRLVRNFELYATEQPDDAESQYLLGRVHSLAFVLRTDTIGVWSHWRRPQLQIPDRSFQRRYDRDAVLGYGGKPRGTMPPPEVLLAHLAASVTHYRRAIELDPNPARFHLGLAYVLERGAHLAAQVDTPAGLDPATLRIPATHDAAVEAELLRVASGSVEEIRASMPLDLRRAVPALLRFRADPDETRQALVADLLKEFWLDEAIASYLAAFERSVKENLQLKKQPMRGLRSLISYESGHAYRRLTEERGTTDDATTKQRQRVLDALTELDAKPPNRAITPIVLRLDGAFRLEDLLAPDTSVHFDLDGDGRLERWPWLRPETALLVWDPARTGRITSGRQLFGSVTWWMLFSDGYRALDALDDDRDGELTGAELAGLALWHDRDGDGVSDAGEVTPLEQTPITGIAARASDAEGVPANPEGLRLRDGRRLPTWDWIVSPAED